MPGPPLETGNNAQVGKYLQCSHKWDTNEYMGGFVKCHSQFCVTDYGVDPDMFEGYGHRESLFERNRKKMSTMFTKWKCREKRMEYLQRHTLSNCKECAILHTTLQNAYPGKKSELSKDVATTLSAAINGKEETHATREILADLQPLFEKQYGHSFTNYLAHSYKLSQIL